MHKKSLSHPAYILSGNKNQTAKKAIELIKEQFCTYQQCGICHVCINIDNKQFFSMGWFNGRTSDHVEEIIEKTAFALNEDESFVFVIEAAEQLNESAANKLLKIVEEPPHGYHFLFLTNNLHAIIPTIKSRCILLATQEEELASQEPLIEFFTSASKQPVEFLQYVSKLELDENDTKNYLDELLHYWYVQLKNNPYDEAAQCTIAIIQNAYKNLPMSGGSKLFWKNLYIALK